MSEIVSTDWILMMAVKRQSSEFDYREAKLFDINSNSFRGWIVVEFETFFLDTI